MMQWIMGLNAINSLTKTLMMIGHKKIENNYPKNTRSFSEILKSEINEKKLSKEKAESIISLYDSNQDWKISVRESGLPIQQFQQWDINKDGFITSEEIQMMWFRNGPFTSFKD